MADSSSATTTDTTSKRARGTTTAKILEALAKGGTMTAAEVALATGISRATVSSTLSRLTRTGVVTKAERGYRLPDGDLLEPPTANNVVPTPAVAKTPRAAKKTSTKAPSKPTSTRKPRVATSAASASASASAPGATKAKVLAALTTDRGQTASDVATATGLGRATVSTTLSRLAKSGDVVKETRGYRLPG